MIRIVVGEDSVLFREGLIRLLEDAGHTVVDAVGDAHAVRAAVDTHRPDLAIIDIRMPPNLDSDGARAAADIRQNHPGIAVLLLSQHIELRDCLPHIGTPGFGYLLKDRVLHLDEFDAALRRVAGGGSAVDPEIVRALVRDRHAPSTLDSLTEREREVLGLVAEGHSNTAVATALKLSERTVEAHMRAVFSKLGLHDDGSTHRRVRAVVTYLNTRVETPDGSLPVDRGS